VIAGWMGLSKVIAVIFGAAIPLFLTAINKDPAKSSSIVLTAVIDVAGFLSFPGIAPLYPSIL